MSNDFFRFQRFCIHQERCAMKVGTDGVLLGAWARGGCRILDVGTGTGLIALMMAQRYPDAVVTGIDIDADACRQATENVTSSPFDVEILQDDVCQLEGRFDSIVTNPPYFIDSLPCPDIQRTLARHAGSLSYEQLMNAVWRLLSDDGELSLIVPSECRNAMERCAAVRGFFLVRRCAIRTVIRKNPRRYLLAFRKHSAPLEEAEEVLQTEGCERSEWYRQLTADFYLIL